MGDTDVCTAAEEAKAPNDARQSGAAGGDGGHDAGASFKVGVRAQATPKDNDVGAEPHIRRKRGVLSFEEVADVCQRLVQCQQKVTIARVKQEVGGSSERVTEFVGEWRDRQRKSHLAGPRDGLLSNEIRAAMVTEVERHRSESEALWRIEMDELREQAHALQADARAATQRADTAENELSLLHEAFEKLRALADEQRSTREQALAQAAAQAKEAQHREATAQTTANEAKLAAAKADVRFEGAHETIQALRRELDQVAQLRPALAAAEQGAAVQAARSAGKDDLLAAERERRTQIETALAQLQERNRQLEITVAEMTTLESKQPSTKDRPRRRRTP